MCAEVGTTWRVVHSGGSTLVLSPDWDVTTDGILVIKDSDGEATGFWPKGCWLGIVEAVSEA